MTRVVVCNCPLHRLTANKSHGFSETHDLFWNELASTILAHPVRILAGDFNMSLWIVAREMRKRALQASLAAAFARADPQAKTAKSDSCGTFLIGPVTRNKPLWGPSVFTSAKCHNLLPSCGQGQGHPSGLVLAQGRGRTDGLWGAL